jgi:hypothetical protein
VPTTSSASGTSIKIGPAAWYSVRGAATSGRPGVRGTCRICRGTGAASAWWPDTGALGRTTRHEGEAVRERRTERESFLGARSGAHRKQSPLIVPIALASKRGQRVYQG